MAELTVNLLGPLTIRLGENSLRPLRSIKAEALLVYLLTEAVRNRRHTFQRAQLMALLWPEMPESSARQNLRQTLYLLRQAVPTVPSSAQEPVPLLLADRQTVQLNPQASCRLDLERFLSLCGEDDAARLERAVALYRGPFLSDFYLEDSNEFEIWAAAHRADLQRLAGDTLARLVQHAWQQGEPAVVERLARRWIDLDDLAEAPQQALVRALTQQGHRSQAIRHYQAYAARLDEALGVEPAIPLDELLADQAQLARATVSPARPATSPLPGYLTPFVGRAQEMARLDDYLCRPEIRLITIVGPGGAGKTRLAVEAIRDREREFADGLFFVPLADLEDSEWLARAIASAMRMSLREPAAVRQQLLAYLHRRRCLLLLDNFERLLPGRDLLFEILQKAAGVRLLVTSQERLGLAGEWLLNLGGLPLVAEDEEKGESPAVRLLVESTRRVRSDFTLSARNRPHVERICQLLQGMPLGLELAASWLRHLDSASLAKELGQNVDFLASSMQNLPPRHRSLRAIFDYTWQRLQDNERQLLQGLGVFHGGFTLPAARAVAGATLAELVALADKSLLQPPAANEHGRYQMQAYLRQFVVEQLEANPEQAHALRARHAAFFADWLARQERALEGAQLQSALARVTDEIENVRAAWRWLAGVESAPPSDSLLEQMVQPLMLFYEVRGWFEEGETQFRLAAGEALAPSTRALMLAVWGWFSFRASAYRQASALLSESVTLTEDRRVHMFALSSQALLLTALGRFDEAQEKAEASLEVGRSLDAQIFKAFALHNLGSVARVQEQYQVARAHYEESRLFFQAAGNSFGAAFALINLGNVEMQLGETAAAEAAFREGLALCERAEYRYGEAVALRSLALALVASGRAEEAHTLARKSLTLAERMADIEGSAWARLALADAARQQRQLPEALQHYRRAQVIFQDLGHTLGQAQVRQRLAEIAYRQGE